MSCSSRRRPRWSRIFVMESGSVTKARMLMRWPQRVRDERILDLHDHPSPAWGAPTPRWRVRGDHDGVGLGRMKRAPDATRVLAVEQRPMRSGIGDVVAHADRAVCWKAGDERLVQIRRLRLRAP